MVESIYFLKPAWCGTHRAGLWPEQDFQSVTVATAFRRWFSLHSTPVPTVWREIAMPDSIPSGSATIIFHQSVYSSQCAVGVTQSNCQLISGQRWLYTGRPC